MILKENVTVNRSDMLNSYIYINSKLHYNGIPKKSNYAFRGESTLIKMMYCFVLQLVVTGVLEGSPLTLAQIRFRCGQHSKCWITSSNLPSIPIQMIIINH